MSGQDAEAVVLRGSALSAEHLRMTGGGLRGSARSAEHLRTTEGVLARCCAQGRDVPANFPRTPATDNTPRPGPAVCRAAAEVDCWMSRTSRRSRSRYYPERARHSCSARPRV